MRTSFAVLALSAVASVSAQQKLYNNTDINVGAVPIADRGKLCQGNMREQEGKRERRKKNTTGRLIAVGADIADRTPQTKLRANPMLTQ